MDDPQLLFSRSLQDSMIPPEIKIKNPKTFVFFETKAHHIKRCFNLLTENFLP